MESSDSSSAALKASAVSFMLHSNCISHRCVVGQLHVKILLITVQKSLKGALKPKPTSQLLSVVAVTAGTHLSRESREASLSVFFFFFALNKRKKISQFVHRRVSEHYNAVQWRNLCVSGLEVKHSITSMWAGITWLVSNTRFLIKWEEFLSFIFPPLCLLISY